MTPGAQLAQSCHCAFAFATQHPGITKNWIDISNYICILEASNQEELIDLLSQAEVSRVPTALFREPDYGDSVTAIALAPGTESKRICANLKLALKDLK